MWGMRISVKPFSAGGHRWKAIYAVKSGVTCVYRDRSHGVSVATATVRVMGSTLEHPCSGEAIKVPILPQRSRDASSRYWPSTVRRITYTFYPSSPTVR